MTTHGPLRSLLAIGACLMTISCDGTRAVANEASSSAMTTRVLNDMAALDAEASTDVASSLESPLGGKAGGHARVHGLAVSDESYSFAAVSTGDFPLAKGEVEAHILRVSGQAVTVHASVTCLAIVGNVAWIGSVVSRFAVDEEVDPTVVGRPMIFRVQDLGEGQGVSELASLVFFPPAGSGGDMTHCMTRPDFPILRVSDEGTVQVMSR